MNRSLVPVRVATVLFSLWFMCPNLYLLFKIRKVFNCTFQISYITCRFTNFCLVTQFALTLVFVANLTLMIWTNN